VLDTPHRARAFSEALIASLEMLFTGLPPAGLYFSGLFGVVISLYFFELSF
jgi:hypothetical protein